MVMLLRLTLQLSGIWKVSKESVLISNSFSSSLWYSCRDETFSTFSVEPSNQMGGLRNRPGVADSFCLIPISFGEFRNDVVWLVEFNFCMTPASCRMNLARIIRAMSRNTINPRRTLVSGKVSPIRLLLLSCRANHLEDSYVEDTESCEI